MYYIDTLIDIVNVYNWIFEENFTYVSLNSCDNSGEKSIFVQN